MKNKAVIGGIIALIIIITLIIFCIWAGKKISDSFTKKDEQPEISKPIERKIVLPPANAVEAAEIYLAPGNPSNAVSIAYNKNNYLMVNTAYALSYNSEKGTANWIAWRVSKNNLGEADRQNDFRPDSRLPKGWTIVKPNDYTRSGFDRGHICPSADRVSRDNENSETFLMTNIAPQTPDLNRNSWRKLEEYSRKLVRRGNVDLYIYAGVYGEKGRLERKITVPTNFWKIIVAVPNGAGISAINEKSHVVAVDMPNAEGIAKTDWRKFRTTIRVIEGRTGYNFFSNLSPKLQNIIENRVDNK